MSCLFCKILTGEIPSAILFEDEHVVAFRDIKPQAPTHCLVIPRKHIPTINDVATEDTWLVGHMIQIGKILAEKDGLSEEGYRLVFNVNNNGGQEVYHIHLHVLGGRKMHWPPG